MTKGNSEAADPTIEKPDKAQAKKAYTKPAFRSQQVFVSTALSCGKTSDQHTMACQTVSKS